VVSLEGDTVQNIIESLEDVQPGIRDKLCDTEGNLRRFVNLYLNEKDVRLLENLETNVTDGDIISIVPTIAGG
jgi:molybdopterin synthase sulfur carrier subunit